MEAQIKPKRKYTRKVKKEIELPIKDIEDLKIEEKQLEKPEKPIIKKFYFQHNFFVVLRNYKFDTIKYFENFQQLLENKNLIPMFLIVEQNKFVEKNKLNSCYISKDYLEDWTNYFPGQKGIYLLVKDIPNISPEELLKTIENLETSNFDNGYLEIKIIK